MRYIVVDLEATCWEGSQVPEMEIIEIGAVELDDVHFLPISEFDQFVRPTERPDLTDFCRELTTIDQTQIDCAPTFADAFNAFTD